ncbi:Hpr(Ser) kinase/phosphatase [Ruegeria halocynthiae]|uniref:Hpr(Ser) kinase/phosphatase n=1 Tax=Ruegeria halocynthiae TaxID=985054 RepID=A0A1H3CYJ9_9RHOB|nr:HPr kinase/phosphatase C-terminal domain-containing protein [Ruegeria halocynthiae]SDX59302.1 Hpr(Ser) kinase/phosphatase [Ruegeria halocynthiae]
MNAIPFSDIADQKTACVHATCVAVDGAGILIIGASGAGKSALALQMMMLGARLVADDRINLSARDGDVMADAVPQIRGLIEARGIGLLRADPVGPVPLAYVVDLDQAEPARLPDPAEILLLGQTLPLLRVDGVPNLAAGLLQLVKMGRVAPEWPNT